MSGIVLKKKSKKPKLLTTIQKQGGFADVWRRLRRNKASILGLVIITMMILMAIFSPIIFNYDNQVIKTDYPNALHWPSSAHPFGTDEFGRDILIRTMYASTISLSIGIITVIAALTLGLIIGAISGYFGGVVDMIIMRIMDVLLAIPSILLAICIVAALGNSILNLILALTISSIPKFSRVTRSSVLMVRETEYVEAARAIGAKDMSIIFRDVLPNSLAPIIVQATLEIAKVILAIASLSFIGLGIPAPMPEWGGMLSASRVYIYDYSYMCLFPGLALMITILSLNLLGDGLRDALDPRLR